MSRVYNFNAGPSTLPLPALEEAAAEFVEFKGRGMSIIEMSHRAKEYNDVHVEATALVKELLGVPDNFHVLFLGGGATLQFSMVPMNLLGGGKSCDFTVTGSWAKKALADAKKIGNVNVVFDGKDDNFMRLPDPSTVKVSPDAAYLHMTSNETIGGIEWHSWPETGDVPIVCDMSSDIMSRRIPVEKFGLIYAGAQKNLGPAGAAVVLIREDVLAQCSDDLTAYLSYKIHAEKNSLYNTPPVFTIYMIGKVMKWVKANGGLDGMAKLAAKRSSLIYDAMDASGGFYHSPVPKECRSKMNIVWRLASEDLEKKFIEEAAASGLGGLKGHRSVGGCRASVYNAMPVDGARAVADFMTEFAEKNG
jgi:phosphoserine aminotransferase